jgi:hypothetical protein
MKPRDSQRSKVYAWERECLRPLDDEPLAIEECAALVAEVWAWHQGAAGEAPTVQAARGTRGFYLPALHKITLAPRARRRYYVLHEVAHAILPASKTLAWHSPEWCAVYARLLERFGGWKSVRSSMRNAGIKLTKETA